MSKINNNPSIINEESVNLVRAAIEHRATWMALMYLEAEKNGCDAEKIARAAIKKCGNIHGLAIKEKCENPDDVIQFKEAFLLPEGCKNFEIDILKYDSDNVKVEFHYCALVNAWKKLGLDDEKIALLCDIAMDGDRGIAEAMGLKLTLTDTIAKGCPTCKLHFHK